MDAAAVYDGALLLLAIYHIIEWIRTTIVLTVVFVGINLVWLYIIGILNTLFGLIAVIYAIAVRFGEEGQQCAEVQEFRAKWLLVEIGLYGVLLLFWPGPILPLACMSKDKHQAILDAGDDDDDEEEDD